MIITETNKEIINLISDYMDKNIDCGIVIKLNNDYITVKHEPIKSAFIIGGYRSEYGFDNVIIIGHYDITSVLKFIKNQEVRFLIKIEDDRFEINKMGEGTVGHIPNKPLHLYSEQEEKELLDLLKKLY